MQSNVETVSVVRLEGGSSSVIEERLVREAPLTIILNDRELVTLLCSPTGARELAVGFLASEGLVAGQGDLKRVIVDDARGVVRIETYDDRSGTNEIFKRFISSGCGRGATFYSAADASAINKVTSRARFSSEQISGLFAEFQRRSELFRSTGGVHSAALCDAGEIVAFAEDIGRHNAVDKVFGRCLLESLALEDKMVLTSGRVSSEILLKVARRGIPVLASRSAPTDLGVRLARDLGVTLAGFVRGKRMNIYANEWRISNDSRRLGYPEDT